MRSRFFLPLLVLLPFGGAAFAQAPGGGPPPPVVVAKPVVKTVTEFTDFTGRFDAMDSVEIRARVSGFIERVAFQDGANVKKGDLLFVIDRRPYRATLDGAIASLASSKARLDFAQGDLERADALRRNGNIAEQLVDQRRQNFASARADQDNAQAVLRSAQLNYDFTEVRAPIDGKIGRRLISEGNLVTANDSLLTTIVTTTPIYFYFDIDERAYLAYSRAMLAGRGAARDTRFTALVGVTDEEPKRDAELDFIDNRVDASSGTVRARAVVPNGDLFLTPGLFGTVRIASAAPQEGVLIPDEAIATDQDRRYVWLVAEDGTPSRRVVQTGPRIDGYRLIRSGLKGDETVVIAGLQRVRPGGKVTPQRQDLPPTRS